MDSKKKCDALPAPIDSSANGGKAAAVRSEVSVNKAAAVKRLIIFYILAFIPLLTISLIMKAVYNEPVWVSQNPDVLLATQATGILGMMSPSLAHLITRLVTREGFRNTYLGWTAHKGNIRYFVISVILKPIEAFVGLFIFWKLLLGDMSFTEVFNTSQPVQQTALVLIQLAFSVMVFFPAFGEEWGWRGYMMPKLMELMPKPAAIVVGGVLWGLWHAPLTVEGHNFGVDYPGFPFVGILLMCLYCIAMNAVLTYLTEKTKSIYPASFCHMINNNLSIGVVAGLVMTEEAAIRASEIPHLQMSAVLMGVAVIAGIVCFVLLCRKEKEEKQA